MISSFYLAIVSHSCPSLSCCLTLSFRHASSSSHGGLLEQVACGSCCCALLVGLQEAAYLSVCVRARVCRLHGTCVLAYVRTCTHVLIQGCAGMCSLLSVHMLMFVHKCLFIMCVSVCLCLSVLL